jgi:hypothetical protein
MNRGAGSNGDVLLFFTPTPLAGFRYDVESAESGYVGGRFDVELDSERWLLKVVGFLISLRSRLSKVSTGDQAIFVRREIFEELGGFPDMPLMEDIAFCRRLKQRRGRMLEE